MTRTERKHLIQALKQHNGWNYSFFGCISDKFLENVRGEFQQLWTKNYEEKKPVWHARQIWNSAELCQLLWRSKWVKLSGVNNRKAHVQELRSPALQSLYNALAAEDKIDYLLYCVTTDKHIAYQSEEAALPLGGAWMWTMKKTTMMMTPQLNSWGSPAAPGKDSCPTTICWHARWNFASWGSQI